jgi:fatty-acyl-CoA synthase
MRACWPDVFGLSSHEVVMPVVPLFHDNGWSLAFSAPMAGATMVMPGMKLDGASIYELLTAHRHGRGADSLADATATPRKAGGDRRLGLSPRDGAEIPGQLRVEVIHGWGMTEMSPIDTICTLKPEYASLTGKARLDIQQKQGHPSFGVEIEIEDDAGRKVP